jgi:hypothetical protein
MFKTAFKENQMPLRKTGLFCKEHGGTLLESDKYWGCDICAIRNHNPCMCGGNARTMGEALFQHTGCEDCNEYVSGVALSRSTRDLWNEGYRGEIKE